MGSRSTGSASSRLALLIVTLLVGLLIPATALAKKRIVVFDFTGPRAERFQDDVEKILRKRYSVISQAIYVKTARRLDAVKPTNRNVADVASDMSVDGLVIGSVKKVGPRYTLTLRVRAGATGEFTETITTRTRKPGLSGDALADVKGQLLAAMVALPPLEAAPSRKGGKAGKTGKAGKGGKAGAVKRRPPPPEPGDDDDDDDGGSAGDDDDRVASAGDDDDDGGRGSSHARGGDDDDSSAHASAGAEVTLSAEQRADLAARGRGLDVAGGVSLMGRRLTFTVRNGLGDLAPRGYQGTPVAGAYVVGELYPMAFNLKTRGITRDIGLTGVVDKVLKIESRLRYQDAMMQQQEAALPTEQMRWGIGVVLRHNFGSHPTSPSVKLAVRYNRAKFIIDKTAAPVVGGNPVVVDIPNMDYAYFDPGVAGRYPLGTTLALLADVRFLLITDTGEMQQMDQYGQASVTGVDIDVGVEYKLNPRLSIRAGGRMIRIGYSFSGGAELTDNRDGDAGTQDVFGALDRYLGGYATAAYLF